MMDFFKYPKLQTEIKLDSKKYPDFPVESIWCGIGSCFSENLLKMFADCGFDVGLNPGGIVYNSYSMLAIIKRAVSGKYFKDKDFFKHNDLWHCWELHGRFSSSGLDKAVSDANSSLKDFRRKLKDAAAVVLTPSSSVVYRLKDSGKIVANCHKVNNNCFSRELLSVKDNFEYLTKTVLVVKEFNPDCKIIFTLSPVRHYPGDLELNARSKANLLSAIRDICDEFTGECIYFPAYEIMQDELRDYRFYKPDMVHPSAQAVEIITRRFVNTFFSSEALEFIKKRCSEARFQNHRPLNT
jgi:hypothetical protein